MMKCITTDGNDVDNIISVALLKKYLNIDSVIFVSKSDPIMSDWLENNYDKVYTVGTFLSSSDKYVYVSGIEDAIKFVQDEIPTLTGFYYLMKDLKAKYFIKNLLKQFSLDSAIAMICNLLDIYIIDKRDIKPVMVVSDSNLLNVCFLNGADICIVYDKKNQFTIIADRSSEYIEFNEELFSALRQIVPEAKYLNLATKNITYGSNKHTIPETVMMKCGYDANQIKMLVQRWHMCNKI